MSREKPDAYFVAIIRVSRAAKFRVTGLLPQRKWKQAEQHGPRKRGKLEEPTFTVTEQIANLAVQSNQSFNKTTHFGGTLRSPAHFRER